MNANDRYIPQLLPIELPVDRAAGDLHLVLPIDVGQFDSAAAMRATLGQGHLVRLVDHRRHGQEGLGAVVVPGLAAGRLSMTALVCL